MVRMCTTGRAMMLMLYWLVPIILDNWTGAIMGVLKNGKILNEEYLVMVLPGATMISGQQASMTTGVIFRVSSLGKEVVMGQLAVRDDMNVNIVTNHMTKVQVATDTRWIQT